MRWAILGTGAHAANKIVPALRTLESETLAGVVGSTAEKAEAFASAFPGCVGFPSLQAMLASPDVDAVFIATPNDQHCSQTEMAAAAGKHVLVEKPMAISAQECRAMIAACERAGVALGIGFQQRHAPVHIALRDLIAQDMLGEIVLARADWHTAYGPWQNWRADPSKSGSDILAAVGVHVFDLLSFVLNSDARNLTAVVDRDNATGMDQTIAATVGYDDGTIGTVTLTRRARSPINSIFVLGTKGSATGLGTLGMTPTGRLDLIIDGKPETREFPVIDLYVAQFADFSEKVRRGGAVNASGADGLKSVLLSERILSHGRF